MGSLLYGLLPLRRQRPDLPGHLGPPVRQRPRQHDPFGGDRGRRVHAGSRRRQLCWPACGPIVEASRGPAGSCASYAWAEAALAVLGLALSLALPQLAAPWPAGRTTPRALAGGTSSRPPAYAVRAALAVGLLAPVTLTMGATLTLLIRALVQSDVRASGWHIARLYGANTAGAAAGALLTDFVLVRLAGLQASQFAAIGAQPRGRRRWRSGAARDARAARRLGARPGADGGRRRRRRRRGGGGARVVGLRGHGPGDAVAAPLRHPARRVPRRLLAGAGRAAPGRRRRRARRRLAAAPRRPPSRSAGGGVRAFVAFTLAGLAWADAGALAARGQAIAATLAPLGPARRALAELWFNLRPMLIEVGLPAFAWPAVVSAGERRRAAHARQRSGAAPACCIFATRPAPWAGRSSPGTCCCRGSGCRPPRSCSRRWRRRHRAALARGRVAPPVAGRRCGGRGRARRLAAAARRLRAAARADGAARRSRARHERGCSPK